MNDLHAQEEIYNALVEKNNRLKRECDKIKKEKKTLTEECRALKSSLSDKTLLLAVDYESMSAAFNLLKEDYRKEKIKLDEINIERQKNTLQFENDRNIYHTTLNELETQFEQKKDVIRSMDIEVLLLQKKESELQDKLTNAYNKKDMIEEEIIRLQKLNDEYASIEKDVKEIQALKETLLKDVESISENIRLKGQELIEYQKKIDDIIEKEQSLVEREGLLSDKESWLDAKRQKLKKAKSELEQFYERKLNHINLE